VDLSQRSRALRATIVFLSLFVAGEAQSRDFRVNQIPHGRKFGCLSCHGTASGGGDFTPFGSATVSALGEGLVSRADIDWSLLAHLDSDRDGFTNGEELGDPNGLWKIGDPDPPGLHYHPGDDRSHPPSECGDGRVTPPEQCDGENFDRRTCISLGLDDGILRCNEDCSLDRSGCGDQEVPIEEPDPEVDEEVEPESDPEDGSGCQTANGIAGFLGLGLFGVFARRREPKK